MPPSTTRKRADSSSAVAKAPSVTSAPSPAVRGTSEGKKIKMSLSTINSSDVSSSTVASVNITLRTLLRDELQLLAVILGVRRKAIYTLSKGSNDTMGNGDTVDTVLNHHVLRHRTHRHHLFYRDGCLAFASTRRVYRAVVGLSTLDRSNSNNSNNNNSKNNNFRMCPVAASKGTVLSLYSIDRCLRRIEKGGIEALNELKLGRVDTTAITTALLAIYARLHLVLSEWIVVLKGLVCEGSHRRNNNKEYNESIPCKVSPDIKSEVDEVVDCVSSSDSLCDIPMSYFRQSLDHKVGAMRLTSAGKKRVRVDDDNEDDDTIIINTDQEEKRHNSFFGKAYSEASAQKR
eukprot:Tbor_TRINITY_DN5189_c0_g1::TRINITY_DN5189_c0_g1_i1::g.25903::m.25903